MSSNDRVTQRTSGHFRTLGICWVVYGLVRLIMTVWLFVFSNTATVMFGALLNRVPDPFAMMADFHVIYTGIVVLSAVCGIFGIVGGLALLAGNRSGRMLTLIAGFLALSNIPVGTTLGIYTLVVLLPISASSLGSARE
jgi:hypothetical protein